MKQHIEEKLAELESLTRKMDIPESRQRSILWLQRNMAVRNSGHKNFPAAKKIVDDLSMMGVR